MKILLIILVYTIGISYSQSSAISINTSLQRTNTWNSSFGSVGSARLTMNFGLNYSYRTKNHLVMIGVKHQLSATKLEIPTTALNSPGGGIGTANVIYRTKGISLSIGYGYDISPHKKVSVTPYVSVGMGYFYSEKSNSTYVSDTNILIAPTPTYIGYSTLEKVFYQVELGSRFTFNPNKKTHILLTPYFSAAARQRSQIKQFAGRTLYTSTGLKIGIEFGNRKVE